MQAGSTLFDFKKHDEKGCRSEFYWLCIRCSVELTLRATPGDRVALVRKDGEQEWVTRNSTHFAPCDELPSARRDREIDIAREARRSTPIRPPVLSEISIS